MESESDRIIRGFEKKLRLKFSRAKGRVESQYRIDDWYAATRESGVADVIDGWQSVLEFFCRDGVGPSTALLFFAVGLEMIAESSNERGLLGPSFRRPTDNDLKSLMAIVAVDEVDPYALEDWFERIYPEG